MEETNEGQDQDPNKTGPLSDWKRFKSTIPEVGRYSPKFHYVDPKTQFFVWDWKKQMESKFHNFFNIDPIDLKIKSK